MEIAQVSDLTDVEKKARVKISHDDSTQYPKMYYWPFERLLRETLAMLTPNPRTDNHTLLGCDAHNWDFRYHGYDDWATPQHDWGLEQHQRKLNAGMIYNKFLNGAIPDSPDIQLYKMFAAPLKRALAQRSKTLQHRELQQKIYVMKFSLAPCASSFGDCYIARANEKCVRVWRLITCYGETQLDTLHDRILGPAMGWTRHYHSYKFVVPTSGACFGPQNSDAIDQMHAQKWYMLDARKYQLCHVLREPGQKLAYCYDLGDQWIHNLELIQVADIGDVLKLPCDEQVSQAVTKQCGSDLPVLQGVQLIAGEINCPPEDSNGCNGMGLYGKGILKHGPTFYSKEAADSMNWKEHRIKNAYDFNLVAHAKRLADAISGKSSSKSGHKVMNMPLVDPDLFRSLLPKTKPGEKRIERDMGIPITETIKTRPDRASEAVCGACGRQPSIEKGKRTALLRCKDCRAAWYCGTSCQRSDWKDHKGRCRLMKKEREAYEEEQVEFEVDPI